MYGRLFDLFVPINTFFPWFLYIFTLKKKNLLILPVYDSRDFYLNPDIIRGMLRNCRTGSGGYL